MNGPVPFRWSGSSCCEGRRVARIFFRNSINAGRPVVECDTSFIQDGDKLEADLTVGTVRSLTGGTRSSGNRRSGAVRRAQAVGVRESPGCWLAGGWAKARLKEKVEPSSGALVNQMRPP